MLRIDKEIKVSDVYLIAKLNSSELWVDGDEMGLIPPNDTLNCPKCKEEQTVQELVEVFTDSEYALECPRCGYYEVQDPRSEVDDDDNNYYV
jgi:Zn ribbon nucleic-acid-binding protein